MYVFINFMYEKNKVYSSKHLPITWNDFNKKEKTSQKRKIRGIFRTFHPFPFPLSDIERTILQGGS